MAAPTLETNAAADTLRILAGTEGNPVTWNDVWDWDDGGGSSGGDGDVPKDGGGTVKVNTFMTEIVADRVYLILKNIDFGDEVVPTYFASENENVDFSSGKIPFVEDNAILRIGNLVNSQPVNGSRWSLSLTGTSFFNDGYLKIYGSVMKFFGAAHKDFTGLVDFRQSLFYGEGHDWELFGASNIFNDVYFYNGNLALWATPTTFNRVRHNYSQFGGFTNYSNSETTMIDPILTNPQYPGFSWRTRQDGDLILINPSPIPIQATISIDRAGVSVLCKFYCNIHIANKDGVNLASATVLCEDTDGTQVFSVTTDANGDIAEQTITYKKWAGTSETLTDYSPHKFTITYAGLETLVMESITVDSPISWHLELQDPVSGYIPQIRLHGA